MGRGMRRKKREKLKLPTGSFYPLNSGLWSVPSTSVSASVYCSVTLRDTFHIVFSVWDTERRDG